MTTAIFGRVAFIRAIGGDTHGAMPLGDLCLACEKAGLRGARSVLATGNILFRSPKSAVQCKAIIAKAIRGFGLEREVFLRDAGEIGAAMQANPFPDAVTLRPKDMIAMFFDVELPPDKFAMIESHPGPERLRRIGDTLFIDYAGGIDGSRLLPGVIERRLKLRGTARNWNTLRRVHELLQAD